MVLIIYQSVNQSINQQHFYLTYTQNKTTAQDQKLQCTLGTLKMREWKNRHGQNCRAGKCRSGNIGTVMQGVENAGVEFAGVLSSLYFCTYMCLYSASFVKCTKQRNQ